MTHRAELFLVPEYGDWRAVERVFAWKRAFLYEQLKQGRVRTALIPGRGQGDRGKGLFSFASIRRRIAELEDNGERRAPVITRAEIAVTKAGSTKKKQKT